MSPKLQSGYTSDGCDKGRKNWDSPGSQKYASPEVRRRDGRQLNGRARVRGEDEGLWFEPLNMLLYDCEIWGPEHSVALRQASGLCFLPAKGWRRQLCAITRDTIVTSPCLAVDRSRAGEGGRRREEAVARSAGGFLDCRPLTPSTPWELKWPVGYGAVLAV